MTSRRCAAPMTCSSRRKAARWLSASRRLPSASPVWARSARSWSSCAPRIRAASGSRSRGMAAKLGIFAGGGELRLRIIEACRAVERSVFVLAFEGEADPAVASGVPHAWVRLGAAGEALRLLREQRVEEIVFAGSVKRPSLLSLRPDWRAAKFLARVAYRALGDDGLLTAIIREFEGEGFRVVGADAILGSALAAAGPLGRHAPDAQAEHDIPLGFRIVRAPGALDIAHAALGQHRPPPVVTAITVTNPL